MTLVIENTNSFNPIYHSEGVQFRARFDQLLFSDSVFFTTIVETLTMSVNIIDRADIELLLDEFRDTLEVQLMICNASNNPSSLQERSLVRMMRELLTSLYRLNTYNIKRFRSDVLEMITLEYISRIENISKNEIMHEPTLKIDNQVFPNGLNIDYSDIKVDFVGKKSNSMVVIECKSDINQFINRVKECENLEVDSDNQIQFIYQEGIETNNSVRKLLYMYAIQTKLKDQVTTDELTNNPQVMFSTYTNASGVTGVSEIQLLPFISSAQGENIGIFKSISVKFMGHEIFK